MPDVVSLEFLARQNERILAELANHRDTMEVLTAMVQRVEGSQQTIVIELRAMQRQFTRMNDRVSKLEETKP